MGERNKHNTWGDKVGLAFREQMRKAKEANAIPFGQERLTPKEAKARFINMSDGERQQFIAERGEENVLNLLRGKNDA